MKNKLETACVFVKVSSDHDFDRFSRSQSQHGRQHKIETNEWACVGSCSARLAWTLLVLVFAMTDPFAFKCDKYSLDQKEKLAKLCLRWFETVFHFPLQLNFMKGLLIYSRRLLLLVDSRCCNNLSTYQLLYSHWHFGCHGNLTGPQIHPISSIQLHFTQNVADKLPFLLHQNCLHIKEHFLRKKEITKY